MNYEIVTGLLAAGSGAFLLLTYQNHQKAQKALKEAKEAVASVNMLTESLRKQGSAFTHEIEVMQKVYQQEIDKRIQKLEVRLDDVNSRVAALQIKR